MTNDPIERLRSEFEGLSEPDVGVRERARKKLLDEIATEPNGRRPRKRFRGDLGLLAAALLLGLLGSVPALGGGGGGYDGLIHLFMGDASVRGEPVRSGRSVTRHVEPGKKVAGREQPAPVRPREGTVVSSPRIAPLPSRDHATSPQALKAAPRATHCVNVAATNGDRCKGTRARITPVVHTKPMPPRTATKMAPTIVDVRNPAVRSVQLSVTETGCDIGIPDSVTTQSDSEPLAVAITRILPHALSGPIPFTVVQSPEQQYGLIPVDRYVIRLWRLEDAQSYAELAAFTAEEQRRIDAGEHLFPHSDPLVATFAGGLTIIPGRAPEGSTSAAPGTYAILCTRINGEAYSAKAVWKELVGPILVTWAYEVTLARLVNRSATRGDMFVRVNGPEESEATLLIEITDGIEVVKYQRTVPTNQTVKLEGLRMLNGVHRPACVRLDRFGRGGAGPGVAMNDEGNRACAETKADLRLRVAPASRTPGAS
jgi:hypothetical protein